MGRYSEMKYIFDMLMEAGCFELLVQRAAGQVSHCVYYVCCKSVLSMNCTRSARSCVWRWWSTWGGSIGRTPRRVRRPLADSECSAKWRRCWKMPRECDSESCRTLNWVLPSNLSINPCTLHVALLFRSFVSQKTIRRR